MSTEARANLIARAEARWAHLKEEQPGLAPALQLQSRLISRQIALLGRPELLEAVRDLPPASEVVAALEADIPALCGLRLEIPAVVSAEIPAFADAAAWGGAGQAGRKIERALASGAVDTVGLARASLARDEEAVQVIAGRHGLNVQVLWFVAGLATAPLAHVLQRALLERGEEPDQVRSALARFERGSCPACGSWPAIAEFFGGERLLQCDFCACAWRPRGRSCAYCAEAGQPFTTIVPDRASPGRRLEVCGSCRGYLKTIDVAAPAAFPLVAIEDLASNDLDRMALHHGFRRMPRRARAAGGGPGC